MPFVLFVPSQRAVAAVSALADGHLEGCPGTSVSVVSALRGSLSRAAVSVTGTLVAQGAL